MGVKKERIKKVFTYQEFYICLIILVFGCIVQTVSGQFFTASSMISLCRNMMIPLIFAAAEVLAIISVGTDVSFPAIAALSSYIVTVIFKQINYEGPIVVIFLVAAVLGMLLGMLNGIIMAKWKFPTLIVTLGTSAFYIGILNGPLKASNVSDISPSMERFGKETLLSATNAVTSTQSKLPVAFVGVILIYISLWLFLRYTITGRGIYAIGGSMKSAENAGFHVNKLIFVIFVLVGALAGIGGTMTTCINYTYNSVDLIGCEMDIIAAVLLGGIKPGKGIGGLRNALLGIMLLKMVQNNLLVLGIPLYWQKAVTGAIIIIGMIISIRCSQKTEGRNLE